MEERKCGNCLYFREYYSGEARCQRYPRTFNPEELEWQFALTYADDVCGEWFPDDPNHKEEADAN